jgi:hypothetical protein
MEPGILTAVQEKKIADLLDDAIKFKGVILEIIDGYFFKVLVTVLDDKVLDKLKAEVKAKLALLVNAILGDDVPAAEAAVAEVLASLIKIPGLDKDSESLLFKAAIEFVVGAAIKWIESKKIVVV